MTEIKKNKATAFTDAVAKPTPPAPDSRIRDMVTNRLRVTTEKATTCTAVTANTTQQANRNTVPNNSEAAAESLQHGAGVKVQKYFLLLS